MVQVTKGIDEKEHTYLIGHHYIWYILKRIS